MTKVIARHYGPQPLYEIERSAKVDGGVLVPGPPSRRRGDTAGAGVTELSFPKVAVASSGGDPGGWLQNSSYFVAAGSERGRSTVMGA